MAVPDATPLYEDWLDFFFGRYGRDCGDEWRMDSGIRPELLRYARAAQTGMVL